MNKKALIIAMTTALFISGCASMGKEDRIGKNDSSDPCFASLNRLDDIAIYYKDERMKDITTGALLGGALGAGIGAAATGGDTTAMILGGVTGAIAGGFAADAYWKNKMQKAGNQMNVAMQSVESDLQQDVNRLTSIDNDLGALLRCRINQRDMIRKNYAEKKISQQQAQQEWKKWGDLVRKDREEMKYLSEALDNIKKLEQSYDYAASVMGQTPMPQTRSVTPSYPNQTSNQFTNSQDSNASTHKSKTKTKKTSKTNKQATKSAPVVQQSETKLAPKGTPVQLLVASVHEKHQSIQKNKAELEHLATEANNDKGFEQISGQAYPVLFSAIELPAFIYLEL